MTTVDSLASRTIARLSDSSRQALAADPIAAAAAELDLTIICRKQVEQKRDSRGGCSGISFLEDRLVQYVETPGSKRAYFTVLHEVGHFLVLDDDDALDWIADEADPSSALETLCDAIAAQLLLPDSTVSATIGAGPVTSRHVLDLYSQSSASRWVSAIAVARYLPCAGAVLVANRESRAIELASRRPDPVEGWPLALPWPGETLAPGNRLASLSAQGDFTGRITWTNQWRQSADFYVDAIAAGSQLVAVLAVKDLWQSEKLHIEEVREFDRRPSQLISCCGSNRRIHGYPCSICGEIPCPGCKECRCDKNNRKLVRCDSCFVSYPPQTVVDGRCEQCR